MVKYRLFQHSRGHYSKITGPIWPGFKLVWESIHVHLICMFQEDPIKTEWAMLMTNVKQVLFQQSREHNSKIYDPIWPVFKLAQDFIHVPLIIKFQEDPIKTEWVMLMTKTNRGFFSNQGCVTFRLIIWSGQFSNLYEISSMSTLSVSFRNFQSKLNKLSW